MIGLSFRQALAITLGLIMSGCVSLPDTPAPSAAEQVVLPDAYQFESAAAQEYDPALLLPYKDPAFVTLAARGMTSAPSVEIAVARITAVRSRFDSANARRQPRLSVDASVQLRRQNQELIEGSLPTGVDIRIDPEQLPVPASQIVADLDLDQRLREAGALVGDERLFEFDLEYDEHQVVSQTGLAASWDPDLFGRLRASREAAGLRLDAVTAEARGVRLALIADIARDIVRLRDIDRRIAVLAEDELVGRELVEILTLRTDAGITPGIELMRAKASLTNTIMRSSTLRTRRAQSLASLSILSGASLAEVVTLTSATPVQASLRPAPAVPVPSALLRSRPDVAASYYTLAAANADVAAAAAQRFPQISIGAGIGLAALSIGDIFTGRALSAAFGPRISTPLFDGGEIEAAFAGRTAQAQIEFQRYRATVLSAIGSVETAMVRVDEADGNFIAAQNQRDASEMEVILAQQRYDRGLDNLLPVLEAKRTTFRDRVAVTAALAEQRLGRIALYREIAVEDWQHDRPKSD